MDSKMDIIGRRVMPSPDGWLKDLTQPGDYGRITKPVGSPRMMWWQVIAPDGTQGTLNPSVHSVTEHEDGTITVSPSIDFSQRKPGLWHGWLERGRWRSV